MCRQSKVTACFVPFSNLGKICISFIPLPLLPPHPDTHTPSLMRQGFSFITTEESTAGRRKLLIDVLIHLEITGNGSFLELENEGS